MNLWILVQNLLNQLDLGSAATGSPIWPASAVAE
ncbi:hypothetical protein NRB56_16890 [Nocardia sp. RB56]|uniref:Uncharacterized protein n=1 Tax=Nocardia aurantia TaxID=2585199 RepID=A0A7K0DKF0_9NOCA|nr:hypothetical protein [Nocardia aurantia]